MSVNNLLANRIKELERELIPEPKDTMDLLHNEGINALIEIYETAIEKIGQKQAIKETQWQNQDTAATQSTTN